MNCKVGGSWFCLVEEEEKKEEEEEEDASINTRLQIAWTAPKN